MQNKKTTDIYWYDFMTIMRMQFINQACNTNPATRHIMPLFQGNLKNAISDKSSKNVKLTFFWVSVTQ